MMQRTAALLSISESYILQRCGGGRPNEAANMRHEKFAAACALKELLLGESVKSVAGKWASVDGLVQKGQTLT